MGKITYCIVDETDPDGDFECEGDVIGTFFSTSPVFDYANSRELIRQKAKVEDKLKNDSQKLFNIFHFAAHGAYFEKNKQQLDYACIYRTKGKQAIEIFRPDTIVRAGLQADVFLSTCCQTFNDHFIDIIENYKGIYNFIAPKDSPSSGDTIIFSLMFYNELLRLITKSQKEIKDNDIIDAFSLTKKAYKSYEGTGNFNLFNHSKNEIYE